MEKIILKNLHIISPVSGQSKQIETARDFVARGMTADCDR